MTGFITVAALVCAGVGVSKFAGGGALAAVEVESIRAVGAGGAVRLALRTACCAEGADRWILGVVRVEVFGTSLDAFVFFGV